MFRFHTGSIKSYTCYVFSISTRQCFDSILVRLKGTTTGIETETHKVGFDSILVRLKVQTVAKQSSSIKSFDSILVRLKVLSG